MRIGIIGSEEETHSAYMAALLTHLGATPFLVDTRRIPGAATFSVSDGGARYNGESVEDIRTWYNRAVFLSLPVFPLDPKAPEDEWYRHYVAQREKHSLICSWLRNLTLEGKRVVNPEEAFDLHFLKHHQIAILKAAGLPLPRTLITNSPQEVLAFKAELGDVVYKPVAGGAICKALADEDCTLERLEALNQAPVLFQEHIRGDNIRVYALENRVLAAGLIHTNAVDYREDEGAVELVDLPAEVAALCVRAMHLCKLVFSGIDIKRTPEGRWVLLECNPSPMFLGFQRKTGAPVSEALAEYLLQG